MSAKVCQRFLYSSPTLVVLLDQDQSHQVGWDLILEIHTYFYFIAIKVGQLNSKSIPMNAKYVLAWISLYS